MRYCVYNQTNGEIIKIVSCLPTLIEQQLANNEQYLEMPSGDDETYYVENAQLVLKPPKPADYYVFDYVTKEWYDPRTDTTQWALIRQQRDLLLQQSDYTQLPDVPLDNKPEWATYRQELRDVTNQPDPFNIVWPVPPA